MITSYAFGRLSVGGQQFRKDLIILTNGSIHHPWWRVSGHRLTMDDLGPVLTAPPTTLVVGTGASGLMVPDSDLMTKLDGSGIAVKPMPTDEAVAEFNALIASGEKVAGCFHLTC